MIEVAITTVPGREELLTALTYQLSEQGCYHYDIYEDIDKVGPFINTNLAFEQASKDNLLILQEDVFLCEDFWPTVERIASFNLGSVVSFFNWRGVIQDAVMEGRNVVKGRHLVCGQAQLWPIALVKDYLLWVDKCWCQDQNVPSDTPQAYYHTYTNRWAYWTAPCLVEHLAAGESTVPEVEGYTTPDGKTITRKTWGETHRAYNKDSRGSTYPRTAALFNPDSPIDVEWDFDNPYVEEFAPALSGKRWIRDYRVRSECL